MLNYSDFKKMKEEEAINEGILGKALGALKDKFALAISKKIGGAKKVDKLIDQRKAELQDIMKNKLKLEEELLLAKRAFEESDDDDSLRTKYEQKKKAVSGQMSAINKKEKASRKKFSVQLEQLKKKGGDIINDYAAMQEVSMEMELANIELEAYKKMGRDTSKLEKKISSQAEVIENKKKELKKAIQKRKEEGSEKIKVEKGNVYDYVNSKGKTLSVKVLQDEADKDGFITVVNVEKEGESDGFRVQPEDLKKGKDTKETEKEGEKAEA